MRFQVFAVTCLLFAAPCVFAQEASSFEQLQMLVGPDDAVVVTDFSGNQTRGRIAALSPSALRLIVNGTARDIPQSEVLEIRQRRSDSLANGAKYGAIAGGTFGVLGAILVCAQEADCGQWVPGVLVVYTALGTGIGVGIDALIIRQRTIFRAPARTSFSRVRVAPILTAERKGLSFSISF
jgi:hypothetical protein